MTDVELVEVIGGGWVQCGLGTVGGALTGAVAGAAVGTVTLPVIGTVSGSAVGFWGGGSAGAAKYCFN
ncbi:MULTISPECIES: Blp family class II bacteriocin [unclassified Streptococcus]|uniref:Blp family class II bacteriocin n=1 Tax=unclassified Streptococcus TaxID=2608887 RepID=UPI001071EAFC|nr:MULTISPECIES: Blp family class II bacteriocin [unclassified Streptococcus]MBF0806781.1 Blp family class II bacteriocin [Streptococcus sp. 19428wA2_WM07]TFU25894.1 ComC/BlpC family peptide pheromone/bacteriocin [Streptococcus sp. WM07]